MRAPPVSYADVAAPARRAAALGQPGVDLRVEVALLRRREAAPVGRVGHGAGRGRCLGLEFRLRTAELPSAVWSTHEGHPNRLLSVAVAAAHSWSLVAWPASVLPANGVTPRDGHDRNQFCLASSRRVRDASIIVGRSLGMTGGGVWVSTKMGTWNS